MVAIVTLTSLSLPLFLTLFHVHMADDAAAALLIRRVFVLKCKEMLEEQRVRHA